MVLTNSSPEKPHEGPTSVESVPSSCQLLFVFPARMSDPFFSLSLTPWKDGLNVGRRPKTKLERSQRRRWPYRGGYGKPIDKPSASIVGRGLLKSLMHRHPPSKVFFGAVQEVTMR